MEIKIYVILEEEKNAGLVAQFLNLSKKRKKKSFTQLSTSSRCHVRVTLRTADPFPASLEPIWLDLADPTQRLFGVERQSSSKKKKRKKKKTANNRDESEEFFFFFL